MNWSQALHWEFSVSKATFALVEATVPAWKQDRKSFPSREPVLRDFENSGLQKHTTNNKCRVRWTLVATRSFSLHTIGETGDWQAATKKERRNSCKWLRKRWGWRLGKRRVCEEVGLFSDDMKGCRKEKIFCALFCRRWCLHSFFNDYKKCTIGLYIWTPHCITCLSRMVSQEAFLFWCVGGSMNINSTR